MRERTAAANTTHGEARKTVEYRAWNGMIQRCTNPRNKNWNDYGGRGIAVHPEWRASYEAFIGDVGRKPSPAHSLDRFPDNDGNYEPGNCRWATITEQNSNRRTSRKRLAA